MLHRQEIRNRLLTSLSPDTHTQLERHLERVDLAPKQILAEFESDIAFAYFIETGSASICVPALGSDWVEILSLGRRDVSGYPLALHTSKSPHRIIVRVSGKALRIPADALMHLLGDNPEMRRVMLRYIQTILNQTNQLIACNQQHMLKQRLPRWLIETSEDLGSNEIPLTQAAAAFALGVRRAGVTEGIANLEKQGLIAIKRGRVFIIERERLEQLACNCRRTCMS